MILYTEYHSENIATTESVKKQLTIFKCTYNRLRNILNLHLFSALKSLRYKIKCSLKLVIFSTAKIQDRKDSVAGTFRVFVSPAYNTLRSGKSIPVSILDAKSLWPCLLVTGPHENMRFFLIQDSHVPFLKILKLGFSDYQPVSLCGWNSNL